MRKPLVARTAPAHAAEVVHPVAVALGGARGEFSITPVPDTASPRRVTFHVRNDGATKDLTVTLPAGHYVLLCNLPGHYMGGMHVGFTVR